MNSQELQSFFNSPRKANSQAAVDENNCTPEEFKTLSPISHQDFEDLYSNCQPVFDGSRYRRITRKDLLLFLCKLRHSISDDSLRTIFKYSTIQAVSLAVTNVRKSLMVRFVSENIDLDCMTREQFINTHVPDFSCILYNPTPEDEKLMVIMDGTCIYTEKSSNFAVQRPTYSSHKGTQLVKPFFLTADDGFILDIQGCYFSDVSV